MTKSRLGSLILVIAAISAVVGDLSRMSVVNDSPVAATKPPLVLEVPSILIGGREFSISSSQQRASAPVLVQRELATRPMPMKRSGVGRRLVSQRPMMDINATRTEPHHRAAAQPLYVVETKPEPSRWRRVVTHVLGGIHDRWVSWRSRSYN
jgi:hypothetical protein